MQPNGDLDTLARRNVSSLLHRGAPTSSPSTTCSWGPDAQPAKGSIKVDEVYGELSIPVIKDQPFFHRLDASAAVRWFDYSTSGSDSPAKAGLAWRPFEDVLIRASWGQGYRAPSIGELFGSASRFDLSVDDPCSDINNQPANIRANCIAHGVPADGSYIQPNPQLPVITSGNKALKPETSQAASPQPEQLRSQRL